ncbi:LOW QUALITY PROTEIN: gamma-tubulin complex component 4 homolog [Drosophila tropicalis]|uniref:LOW QUALITY PROTEIN: gamma-tubulin complex component 4 homolog n=1 Tax=Drosophila tropicalis TaxID=46794 RepID=UPI0035ABCA89
MIQDILLSCLSQGRNGAGIMKFLATDVVEHFIHPCERGIFIEILKILNNVQEVVAFTKPFGLAGKKKALMATGEEADSISGFYLVQFAHGVENGLEEYYKEIIRLESLCSQNELTSMLYVHNALQIQLPIIMHLRKLVREVKMQKLHGCALLHSLHQQSEHGDPNLHRLMTKVLKPVKSAFFSHLAHWLLFGVLDDVHSEFFIKFIPLGEDNGSQRSAQTASSDTTLLNADMRNAEDYVWQYEVNMKQIPGFISMLIAEKVLFVGQTVLIFKINQTSGNKHSRNFDETRNDDFGDLWNGKEQFFYNMIDSLNNYDQINVFHIERIIVEIKKYVSTRLSEIAIKETDLLRQMSLIKDFYLLGRGEFYMEFFHQLKRIESESEINARSYTKAFECAAVAMSISEDLENFTLSVERSHIDLDETCDFDILRNVHLKYTCKFPLNLLFCPKVIERYNKIFRFLLVIRKLQKTLQDVWANQTWSAKTTSGSVNVKVMNFRNHLLFFLDNIQFYIQVDVLESQFSIIMKVIKSGADFEEIQRAHTVFLANVLSQCFLLSDANASEMNITATVCKTQNPIYGTILALLNLCEKFGNLSSSPDSSNDLLETVDQLEKRFNVLIASLVQLLVDIKSASILGPLSQLLLRLDYNHWFSAGQNTINSVRL